MKVDKLKLKEQVNILEALKKKGEVVDTITTRLAGVTNIPKEYLTETPPVPKSVKIELSSRCNYRCAYCALSTRESELSADMDFVLFKKITNEIKKLGVQEFGVFYIGESFVNPNLLIKSVKYLKGVLQVPYVFLTSNASLADVKHVKRCMEGGLSSLKWSCNFADFEQFKALSGTSNEEMWKRAIVNIRTAWETRKKNNHKTGLYASSIMYNKNQEERMQPFLDAHVRPYVDEHYWLPLFNEVAAFPGRTGKVVGNVGNYYAPVEPLPCWTAFTAAHIMVDGRVSACCHDAVGHWVMGDLTKQSFMGVWHSEEFQKLRGAHLAKDVTGTKCELCIDSTKQINH